MPSNTFFTASAALLSVASAAMIGTGTGIITNSAGSTIGSVTQAATGLYPIPTTNVSSSSLMGTATSSRSSSAAPASVTGTPESLFCPGLNNEVFTDSRGHSYLIKCDITHYGSFIDVDISINQTSKAKRATIASLASCIAVCDDLTDCVATSFNKETGVCAYYSAYGAEVTNADYDFAVVYDLNDDTTGTTGGSTVTVVPSGSPVTSAVLSTTTQTVSSCPATITNCPLNANGQALVTGVVTAYTTVCPCSESGGCTVTSAVGSASSGAASAAASGAVSAGGATSTGTATVYSSTVVSGTTTVVPVGTAAVEYASGSGTTNGATTTATITCTSSSCQASATSVEAFTGAAASVKAGMGMAAVMAIIALVL